MAYAERIARAKREYESDLGWLERDRTALNELEIIIEKFNAAEDEDWMAGVRDYFRARDDGKGRDPMPKKTKKV
jgi:hypothetical protein